MLHGLSSTGQNLLSPQVGIPKNVALTVRMLNASSWSQLVDFSLAYLLENGALYHIANGTALFEYLVVLHFYPTSKSYPFISQIGKIKFQLFQDRY